MKRPNPKGQQWKEYEVHEIRSENPDDSTRSARLNNAQDPGQETRTGNLMPRLAPFGVFATCDGHIAICAPTDDFTASLFAAMGQPGLKGDARFVNRDGRVANHADLHALVQQWIAPLATDEAVSILEQHGVPSGRVRSPGEATRDPRLLARGETERLEHPIYGAVDDVIVGGLPIRMTGSFTGFDRAAPSLGEHSAQVFGELLGLTEAHLAELAAAGVL